MYKPENDYSNNSIHSGVLPSKYISNVTNSVQGYPKLHKLKELKKIQIETHLTKPYGCRISPENMVDTISEWNTVNGIQFDVIMIGAMNTQSSLNILKKLPLTKICAKPGFLFIWATQTQIIELTEILNHLLNKKFRRSEELIFLPYNEQSKAFPRDSGESMFRDQQWHCWMCITGTVRRTSDQHLIHCNVDTDLQFETKLPVNNIVPDSIYKVAENFSNSNRRLHIIPYSVGYDFPVRSRRGWVIMSPDILLNNFDPIKYETELHQKSVLHYKNNQVHYLVGQTKEIEDLRPKSPVKGMSNS